MQKLFSEEEFKSSISKCKNLSTPGPNKLSQKYLKVIVNDSTYLKNFINIANIYINLGHCCGNHLSQRQMITQVVNLLKQILSGNFTRELDKESLLNQSSIYTKSSWSMLLIINPALMSILLPHVCLKVAMLYTYALMLSSRSFYYLLGL